MVMFFFLQDLLENDKINLDEVFKMSLIEDIVKVSIFSKRIMIKKAIISIGKEISDFVVKPAVHTSAYAYDHGS